MQGRRRLIDAVHVNAPWRFAATPASARNGGAATLACRVSAVPHALVPAIEDDGLRAASADGLRRLLVPAQGWLGAVPELERLVLHLVRDIHSLAAEPGYDVSHSQPRWRERIFVSCPERGDDVGALRLIESVIHEAMHLHLTSEEEHASLIAVPSGVAHSPWREADRPVQGVMHGLYVFTCIHSFLRALTITPLLADEPRRYVARRLGTIDEEIGQVDLEGLSRHLTPRGRASVVSWVEEYRPADTKA